MAVAGFCDGYGGLSAFDLGRDDAEFGKRTHSVAEAGGGDGNSAAELAGAGGGTSPYRASHSSAYSSSFTAGSIFGTAHDQNVHEGSEYRRHLAGRSKERFVMKILFLSLVFAAL